MRTRLYIFCDKLLEAGWLAALIVVPLFFNIYSSRVFEPEKLSLLRSIVLMMVGAWVIRQFEASRQSASNQTLGNRFKSWLQSNPLALPTLFIVGVYLVSTIFSLVPSYSLWGGYQRMQGTYTTFSYIVIFFVLVNSLRTRAQLDRVLNTITIVAFPVAVYGIIQHSKIDPLPWAGDVTQRVAANMGNAIFVAAYLIMVLPVVLARWLETLVRWNAQASNFTGRVIFTVTAVAFILITTAAWMYDFYYGVIIGLLLFPIMFVFSIFAKIGRRDALLMASFTNIFSAVLVTIFFSQSRGPWLGLLGGLFVFILLYAFVRNARRVVMGIVGLGILGSIFLLVFNLPASPLEPLRSVPYVGRLGTIFELEGGTGLVRELIWKGALELMLPHPPLWSPLTGDDSFSVLRPMIGYGPEAMVVAFNPFYQPELAHVEARNASPDRSHNEAWDALITTGLIGFIAYILLFMSVFYYGFKWLGVVTNEKERNVFIAMWLIGGLIGTIVLGLWRGWHFLGIGLPIGMVAGAIVFLVGVVIVRKQSSVQGIDPSRALLIAALIAALIAHFIEIHFGIAIASTRTYFWFYAALLVILGMNRVNQEATLSSGQTVRAESSVESNPNVTRRRKGKRFTNSPVPVPASSVSQSEEITSVLGWTMVVSVILIVLGFDFIINQSGATSALDTMIRSLINYGNTQTYVVLLMFVLAWMIAGFLGLNLVKGTEMPWISVALYAVLSLTVFLWFSLIHVRWITTTGNDPAVTYSTIIFAFYIALFLGLVGIALGLMFDEPSRGITGWARSPLGVASGFLTTIVMVALIYVTNLTGIQADIIFKVAQNFDANSSWEASTNLYQRVVNLQPMQDYYYLFLGRAYLEGARGQTDFAKRNNWLTTSEKALLDARRMSPLNTDNSANLGRIHSTWAGLLTDAAQKVIHLQKSSEYFQDAIRLSPNTAFLRNEYAQTLISSGDLNSAQQQLEGSIKIDAQFAPTYILLGEIYRIQGNNPQAAENYFQAIGVDGASLMNQDGTLKEGASNILYQPDYIKRTIDAFQQVVAKNPTSPSPHYALADLYKRNNQRDLARKELDQIIRLDPTNYVSYLTLVNFLSEGGQIDDAVTFCRRANDLAAQARSSDTPRIQEFCNQLQAVQKLVQAVQKTPDDVTARRNLANTWKARGQLAFALSEFQALARLASNDYEAQKNLVLLNLQLSRLDNAQAALPSATALAPDNEKPIWQNAQVAINAQRARQFDQAIKAVQAAMALASEADKPAWQAYLTLLQNTSK
jgi:tetratricopeptide (TPR) repeat protein